MPPTLIASAAARLVKRGWGCPDCAGVYGCQAPRRSCETCSPPRNPARPRNLDEDDL